MNSIHKKVFLVPMLLVNILVFSQVHHGFSDDNYSGVYGVVSNPANVVDSRYRFNVNVGSFNGVLSSDYETPKLSNLSLFNNGFKSSLFEGPLQQANNLENNQTYANVDFLAPGSFMLNINEKHAVALVIRGRTFSNYNNFNGPLWKGLANGFLLEQGFEFDNQNLDATTHYWSEIGFNYGTIILDQDEHFLKAGGTFKLLQGLGAEQIQTPLDNLQGSFSANSVNSSIDIDGNLEYIRTFDVNNVAQNIGFGERLQNAASGIGFDFGAVYEYRTRETRRVGIGKNSQGSNKYKLKLSASLLDMGKIDYGNVSIRTFNINGASIGAAEASENFFAALSEFENPLGTGNLEIALPTSIQVNIDYFVKAFRRGGAIYLNGSFNTTAVQAIQPFNNNRLNLFALTPRYETKNLSIYLPISYSELSSVNFGFGARLGPVTVGSASLINFFTGDGSLNNLFVGVSIPAYQDKNQAYRTRGRGHKKRRNHKRWSKRSGRKR